MIFLDVFQTINDWSVVLEGSAGEGHRLTPAIERHLQSLNNPEIIWKEDMITEGVFSKREPYFAISGSKGKCRDFRMIIASRDYGTCLDVSWKLLRHKDCVLNPFEENEVQTFISVTHLAVKRAIEDISSTARNDRAQLIKNRFGV